MEKEKQIPVLMTMSQFNAIKRGLSIVSQFTKDRELLDEAANALGDLSYQITKKRT